MSAPSVWTRLAPVGGHDAPPTVTASAVSAGSLREWCSSGSSAMSRRVSPTHRHTMITSATRPTTLMTRLIVVPTTISVIAIAVARGRMLGPGRWSSSPAGGAGAGMLDLVHGWT